MKLFLTSWGLLILSAFLDSYAATIVKTKFNELGAMDYSSLKGILHYLIQFFRSPLLLSAVMAFVTAPVLWFFALNRMGPSTAYPALVGFHLLFVLLAGLLILEESISVNKMIGIGMVACSLYFFYKA